VSEPAKVLRLHEERATRAAEIARAILAGFDRHYRLFRQAAVRAKTLFEQGDWPALRELARERIAMYDRRVQEGVDSVLARFPETETDETLWPSIKLAYIPLLHEHRQPELAETFFNSVACQILHRRYYRNEFIFWRPAVATEHLEGDEPGVPQLLPAQGRGGLAKHAGRNRARLRPREPLRKSAPRPAQHHPRAARAFSTPGARPSQPADPGPRLALLPQQGCLHPRQGAERQYRAAVRRADPAERREGALPRHAARRRGRARRAVFVRARLLLRRHGGAGGLRIVPAPADAEEAARRDVHVARVAQAGQDVFYRDLFYHLRHSSDNFVVAPGIKGW
jgi:isocitrate dehydrogenase kinase/phosphatase